MPFFLLNSLMFLFVRYEGLSDKFLSCPVQKILLLAGTDRLDRFVRPEYEKFCSLYSTSVTFAQHYITSLLASDLTQCYSLFAALQLHVATEWVCEASMWHVLGIMFFFLE